MEYKYTGHEVESIGLYYYGARYYDPEIGRFITEDTYPGEMNNPQSQHLYVYVINNPLVYTDPTGNVRAYFADSTISYPEEETESNEQVINPRSNNNTHIERPNTSYNPITKSLKSFGEIAKGLWGATDERRKHALDSPYYFANYMTIGILDATWAGAKAKASKRFDSVYDFANWITIGTVDTFSGALNPDEVFSAEHLMDSLAAAAIVTGGIKMADKVAPGIVSVKDDIARVYDDLFKKKTMGTGKLDDLMNAKSLGKGSTGRTVANSLNEQLAMKEVLSNPLSNATDLSKKGIKLGDFRWKHDEGWVKMSKYVNGIEIHFNYNKITKVFDDFKFID